MSVEIVERGLVEEGRHFGDTGAYEQIVGRITFAIDPADPVNQVIVNLDRAPRNGRGLVEATADLLILAPADPQLGNCAALIDIANRGRLSALGFNRGGAGPYGDGFLMNEGYTIVWVGWEFDVPSDRPIRLDVPSVDGVPVGGLGFAAVRDTASWIKYEPQATVTAEYTLSFGSSQSGRFLRTFLYLGFNTDTSGRQVFDGMIPHIAGASRLALNQPGAAPISLGMFDATSFPFADAALRDPVTGVVDGSLGNHRSQTHQPYVLYTNTGVEYWGGGRVATLVHSTPDGTGDLALQDNVRFYFLTGTQHGPGQFPPPPPGNRQEMGNPDRLLVEHASTVDGADRLGGGRCRPAAQPPPPVCRRQPGRTEGPRVSGDTRRPLSPRSHRRQTLWRTHGWTAAPRLGCRCQCWCPRSMTTATSSRVSVIPRWRCHWPPTRAGTSRILTRETPTRSSRWPGSYIPFPATREQRKNANDPRRSIEERYASRDDYLARVETAGQELISQRYLRAEDLAPILERAAQHWDLLMGAR